MPRPTAPRALIVAELDLGDTSLVVREYPDGMFTLDLPTPENGPLVVTTDLMQQIVGTFARLGSSKGWL